tara:strand:+ start:405 stop:560 length:156 start_codon:yes stop_codon:yes gene_type:complete
VFLIFTERYTNATKPASTRHSARVVNASVEIADKYLKLANPHAVKKVFAKA